MNGHYTTSLIVATHNRDIMLSELLTSVSHMNPKPDEVIVCDDGSLKPVNLESLEIGCPIKLIRQEIPTGPGGARNRAVHFSRGEILLFTDDDCIVSSTWGGILAYTLESFDESVAGVGGKVLARDTNLISQYYEYHRVLEPRPHNARDPGAIPYLVTANCAVRRDAFMKAGGFDTRLPTAGGEDAALSMRMIKLGYSFQFVKNAIVWHRFRPQLQDFVKTFYRYGLGGRYVVDRYLPC